MTDTAGPQPLRGLTVDGLSVDDTGQASPLVVAIDEAVAAQHGLEQQLRAEFGINNTDFRALLLVFRTRRASRTPRVSDLTRALGLTSGAASQSAARLGAAGLLQQDPDPNDRRAGTLTLTHLATQRLDDATREVRSDLDRITGSLRPEEEQRIIDLLHQVRDVFTRHQHH